MSQQLMQAGRNIVDRFGGFNVGCAALGCLLPASCVILFFVSTFFWAAPAVQSLTGSEPTEQRRLVQVAPASRQVPQPVRNGVIVQTQPTPIYAGDNAQGGVYQPGVPSMMGNQQAQFSTPLQPYAKYEGWSDGWGNSLASKSSYLAGANFRGDRRTPYSRGQVITYPDGQQLTVVTGDFDFTLLQDVQGHQWYCGPFVNTLSDLSNCQFWN